jgi:hypothetical protein
MRTTILLPALGLGLLADRLAARPRELTATVAALAADLAADAGLRP